jgi:glutamate racemase
MSGGRDILPPVPSRELPIGLFDSGIGGLTVARAVRELLPDERLLYLGDTARVPYGTKSAATVQRYALQVSDLLLNEGIKALVVACNTASAHALPLLREHLRAEGFDGPVLGVVDPGARAACTAAAGRPVLVLATEGTLGSGVYQRALQELGCGELVTRPCPLFVALAEEGWQDNEVAVAAARRYLGDIDPGALGAVLLGCTHYPIMKPALHAVLGKALPLVDSAGPLAQRLLEELRGQDLLRVRGNESPAAAGSLERWVTDDGDRLTRVGERFLGHPVGSARLVDLGGSR